MFASDDITSILSYRAHLAEQIETLTRQSEDLTTLESALLPLERTARALAESLSAARKRAATKLSRQVETALKDLGLERATFEIQVTHIDRAQELATSALGAGTPSALAPSTGTFLYSPAPIPPTRVLPRTAASAFSNAAVSLTSPASTWSHTRMSSSPAAVSPDAARASLSASLPASKIMSSRWA